VGLPLNRSQLQKLSRQRLLDAKALLGRKRWAGSYYLCGYAVECGLKACILRHLGESGAIFGDLDYLKSVTSFWTHDLVRLVKFAGLEPTFGGDRGTNPTLAGYWNGAVKWRETSRYEENTEADARALYEALTHNPDGVFRWIHSRW
jgi:hypothetical protein